jgi:hypothetical protein
VFGSVSKQDVVSACFLPRSGMVLVTGVRSGDMLIWCVKTRQVRQTVAAHQLGQPLPSALNGRPMLPGVRVLSVTRSLTQLISGGADGMVMKWNIPENIHEQLVDGLKLASVFQLNEELENTPVSFSALDCHPLGTPQIVVGTHR